MEIRFNQTGCDHLRSFTDQILTREETQEIRLPEGMPDIGRVLGCWGQPVIRSKEWRSGGMGISGGVTVWVLYLPEDGTEPRTVEGWVPFQQKWEFDDEGRDGYIWVHPLLKSLDARSVSPRKLMVRANVSTRGRALQPHQQMLYQPENVPEDVQLLRQTYPMELPIECGEKPVQLDEELQLPDTYPMPQKLLYYCISPRITEQKTVGSRLVFRGTAGLRLLYLAGEKLHSWDTEIPFSQYGDLERDLSPAAEGEILPVVTDLELSLTEGRLRLKASLAAQYILWDRVMVELVEDAYSPRRTVEPHLSEILLPARLDHWKDAAQAEQNIRCEMGSLVDVSVMLEHPQHRSEEAVLSGNCQMLYYDPAGQLQSGTARLEQAVSMETAPDLSVFTIASASEMPRVIAGGEGVTVTQPVELEHTVTGRKGMAMVTGLEVGEPQEPDPGRPSVILRRCQAESLWSLAKKSGSTVDAIRSANGLEGEPEPSRMLLIPIG